MAPPRYSDIQAKAKAVAVDALKRGKGPAAAARAAIDAAEAFLAHVIKTIGLQPQMAAIQCGAGCYHCCHQMVGITSAELALLRAAVDALPEPARTETRARIADIAERGKGLDQAGWWGARLRCALLDDAGRCLVHGARPLPCRAMNSSSAETCRRSYAGETLQIPILAAQHRIHGHAQMGLAQALAEMGEDTRVQGLGTAL
ncbi:MAG TPA: YkgJ family cysteine cluster protein [Magnetospirillum sp.]|nr:YkgJ family cysteine cluster protein [Magnetospirillum sp.]